MKNKIIVFTNIKGGTGKTQLCATAATFFLETGFPVFVIDADIQQSISRHRKRDKDARPHEFEPWNIYFLNTADIEEVKDIISQAKAFKCLVLIDCPGNINDPGLKHIYDAADMAVIPMEYNPDVVDATVMFAEVLRETSFKDKNKPIFFIPNKVSAFFEKNGVVRKAREDAYEQLVEKNLGVITPEVRMTTLMNGYSTLDLLGHEKRKVVREALIPIIKRIKMG